MARDFVTGLLPDGPAPSDQEPSACDPSRGPAPGDLNYRSEWEASREISHDEAREIARRLIASHFRRTDCETARVGIPARPDYDDDLLICSYIKQQSRKDAFASCGWQPIATVPEGVEVLVTGGLTVLGRQPYGRRVALILDRNDLYREDNGELCGSSPTMWRPLPDELPQGIEASGQDPKGLGAEHESPSAEGGAP